MEPVHPADRARVDAVWEKSLKTRLPYEIAHRLLMKDGRVKWVHETGETVFDEKGSPVKTVGIIQDITERRQMEEAIFMEKERLKTTLLSIGDGVISTDNRGRVLLVNRVAEELTGWAQEDAFGLPLEDIFHIVHEYSKEPCANPALEVLETGNMVEIAGNAVLISKNGVEWAIEDTAAPIEDEEGNISGVVLVFRDVTDKR